MKCYNNTGRHQFVAVLEGECREQDVVTHTLVVCRRLQEECARLKQVLKIKQSKGRSNVAELQSGIDAIAHLHFLYATSDEAPRPPKDGILKAIRDLKVGFPLPTVEVLSSAEVDEPIAAMTGVRT